MLNEIISNVTKMLDGFLLHYFPATSINCNYLGMDMQVLVSARWTFFIQILWVTTMTFAILIPILQYIVYHISNKLRSKHILIENSKKMKLEPKKILWLDSRKELKIIIWLAWFKKGCFEAILSLKSSKKISP